MLRASIATALAFASLGAQRPTQQLALYDAHTVVSAPAVDPTVIAESLSRAIAAEEEGRFAEARRIYKKVIHEQQAEGEFAGAALWRLALSYYNGEDRWNAAMTFDQLAGEANKYGDPAMELRATFEATALWLRLKRADLVPSRMERVKQLLQSPVISDEAKSYVKDRL